jgi:hypothetical protein
MRLKDLFGKIALGQQICIVKTLDQHPVPGRCERNGAVINKVKNTHTEYLVVLFEDGHKENIGEITTSGTGAYLYPDMNTP